MFLTFLRLHEWPTKLTILPEGCNVLRGDLYAFKQTLPCRLNYRLDCMNLWGTVCVVYPAYAPRDVCRKGTEEEEENVREWLTCMGRKKQNCYCGGYDDFATFARRGGRRGR